MAGEYIEFNNNSQPAFNDTNINLLQRLIKQDIDDSKANYSTDEKEVGTWIDGKTLYEKTFVTTTPVVTNDGTMVEKNITFQQKVDTVFIFSANVKNQFMLPMISSSLQRIIRADIYKQSSSVKISLFSNSAGWSNYELFLTLRYTKDTN